MARPSEVVFSLRIDENLYKKVRLIAESDRRSINNQIVLVLEKLVAGYEKKYGPLDVGDE